MTASPELMAREPTRVLAVAESDSCGAAGIQADVKTILALGGYAMTALSAVTAQNTSGIAHLQALEPSFVEQQMRMALEDIGAEAIKIGLLVNTGIINAVSTVLDDYKGKNIPVVINPAIVARDGKKLMDEDALAALKRRLFIRAAVLTPNLRSAELLTGMNIRDMDDIRHAATMLRTLGAENVLLRAAGTGNKAALYLLATEDGEKIYERPTATSQHLLGEGATLASAIAVGLAQKKDIAAAVEHALDFTHKAILTAPRFATASGAGPVNHACLIDHAHAIGKSVA
jgi:hydroxymethylpyrimidine/phosphomethylpyrimidine kinase